MRNDFAGKRGRDFEVVSDIDVRELLVKVAASIGDARAGLTDGATGHAVPRDFPVSC
jgi:hypothetical protein